MKKVSILFSVLFILALALSACASPGDEGTNGTGTEFPSATESNALPTVPLGTEALPDTGNVGTPAVTTEAVLPTLASTATTSLNTTPMATQAPNVSETPGANATPGVRGAQILPDTGRADATRLSNLMNYKVVDMNGAGLGTASDYILNMCEAHILYIVLDADPSLGLTAAQTLVPYEAVTLENGVIDTENKTIKLNFNATELQTAPAFDAGTLDLSTADWEGDVQSFWSGLTNLTLTSACQVAAPVLNNGGAQPAGTPAATQGSLQQTAPAAGATTQPGSQAPGTTQVTKLALASEVLSTQVQDANGKTLGQVEEVVLEPESGLLRYAAVRLDESLQNGGGLVLVPIRALNVNAGSAGQGGAVLVLLVDQSILESAPTINGLSDTSSPDWDADAFQYWSQHVPLMKEDQQ